MWSHLDSDGRQVEAVGVILSEAHAPARADVHVCADLRMPSCTICTGGSYITEVASYRGAESEGCLDNQQSCCGAVLLGLLTSLRLVVWRVSSVALAQSAGASFMTPASFTCIPGTT